MRTTLVSMLAVLAQWGATQMLNSNRRRCQPGPPPRMGIWSIHPRTVYSSLCRTPKAPADRRTPMNIFRPAVFGRSAQAPGTLRED